VTSAGARPLVIDALTRRFGTVTAVSALSLEVRAGEIVGFLGANGAGKTTTLRCASGLLAPDEGTIHVAGADLEREPRVAKARLGLVPDRPFLYDRLSAREFLAFVAALYDLPAEAAARRAEELLARLALAEHADRTIEGYSLGMRQKTAIAAALLHSPPLLLLVEPLYGLDPPAARLLKELLREHARAGGGVLVSTHLLDVAERLCDRVVILRAGSVMAEGTLASLRGEHRERSLEDVFLELGGNGA
jgi:ABC-2 type transport system ATP-binding protein